MAENLGLAELVVALTTDVVSASHLPLPTTTGLVLARIAPVASKRVRAAVELLWSKVTLISRRSLQDEGEELAAIIARYLRAAQEGAARKNLELMADVIAGMAEQETVEADAFLRHSNILADLSSREIGLLRSIIIETEHDGQPRSLGRDAVEGGKPLIPTLFENNRKVVEACAALIRTGYVMPLSRREGHMGYRTTESFEELAKLVDLRKHGAQV